MNSVKQTEKLHNAWHIADAQKYVKQIVNDWFNKDGKTHLTSHYKIPDPNDRVANCNNIEVF